MLAVGTAGLLAMAGTVAFVPASGFVTPSAGVWNTARGGSKATTTMAAGIFGEIFFSFFCLVLVWFSQHVFSFAIDKNRHLYPGSFLLFVSNLILCNYCLYSHTS